jgi:hypothetical protein
VKKRFLEEGDELGIDWERWADGLPHRLKRKRDFADVHPRLVREAAKNYAGRTQKGVQSVADRARKNKYVWVQFADHEIRIGEPCPCGGRRLLRVHPFFARCADCKAQLLLAPKLVEDAGVDLIEDAEDDDERPEPGDLLLELSDVHLARIQRIGDREVYRGYGRRGSSPMLLIVHFRAARGERLSKDRALDRVVGVQMLPFQQLSDLVDESALTDRSESEWDLVL